MSDLHQQQQLTRNIGHLRTEVANLRGALHALERAMQEDGLLPLDQTDQPLHDSSQFRDLDPQVRNIA